jgi:hypothetical protein
VLIDSFVDGEKLICQLNGVKIYKETET